MAINRGDYWAIPIGDYLDNDSRMLLLWWEVYKETHTYGSYDE